MTNYYHKDHPRHANVMKLGNIEFDCDFLKDRPDIPFTHNTNDDPVYELKLKVNATVSEKFFHTLQIRALWDPNIDEGVGDKALLMVDPNAIQVNRQALIDCEAAFNLSAN